MSQNILQDAHFNYATKTLPEIPSEFRTTREEAFDAIMIEECDENGNKQIDTP